MRRYSDKYQLREDLDVRKSKILSVTSTLTMLTVCRLRPSPTLRKPVSSRRACALIAQSPFSVDDDMRSYPLTHDCLHNHDRGRASKAACVLNVYICEKVMWRRTETRAGRTIKKSRHKYCTRLLSRNAHAFSLYLQA